MMQKAHLRLLLLTLALANQHITNSRAAE